MRNIAMAITFCCSAPGAAMSASITIPWLVEFPTLITNPPPPRTVDVSAPEIEGAFRTSRGGIDAPGLDISAGFNVNASAITDASAFRFPVDITIEAPDEIRPGQLINLTTSFTPIDTITNPAFYRLNGRAAFDTDLSFSIQSDTFGVNQDRTIDLPDNLQVGAVSLTFGGEETFSAEDSTARVVAGRASFSEDPFGQFLVPRGTLTQGYQFEAIDRIDGVAAGVDLIDLAADLFPPIAPIAAVADLDASGGLDIVISNTLTTNLGVAYYTYPGLNNEGFIFDQIDLTRGGVGASVRAPDTLTPGDTFDLMFSALGLGFNVLTELAVQGAFSLDLSLDLLLKKPSLNLLSFPLGDPVRFDQDITKFFYLQFLAEFMDPDDAILSMSVVGDAPSAPILVEDIVGPTAADDALVRAFANGLLPAGEPAGLGLRFDVPGEMPIVLPTITTTAIPLPSTFLLLGAALGALATGARSGTMRLRPA